MCFVSEEQWKDVLCKLNLQATGMSKWSKFQPRFRVSNSKWKTGWERRTEEQICSSYMWVYTLFMMGVTLQRIQYHRRVPEPLTEPGVGTVVRLTSKINPDRTFQSLQQIRKQNWGTEYVLHFKMHVQHKQAHVMLMTQLWCAQL